MGKKKQPTYRVVVADSRSPRDGRFIEIIGQYDPRSEPSTVNIDSDKAVAWLSKGAQPTEQVGKLLEITGVWERFRAETGRDAAARPAPKTPKLKQAKAAEAPVEAAAEAATEVAAETPVAGETGDAPEVSDAEASEEAGS